MIRAILFDCNGIIADDEPIHLRLLQKVLKEEGVSLTRKEYFQKYLALDDRTCFWEALRGAGEKNTPKRVQELIDRKSYYYRQVIKKELKIFPGVKTFVKKHQKDYTLGVVSGALRHEIKLILKRAGIFSAFSVLVSAEDVRKSKPDPECYLKAWKSLNLLQKFRKHPLRANECLAIEDSIHGIQAAHRAGLKCLAVTNSYSKKELCNADVVVQSLERLRARSLLA